jgi:hypothetical protein
MPFNAESRTIVAASNAHRRPPSAPGQVAQSHRLICARRIVGFVRRVSRAGQRNLIGRHAQVLEDPAHGLWLG